ncbi:MAG: hypothetical protein PHU03_06250, partial [Syntrophales bacterium]|nr:hypothetical protein [Syntrophales bacterium]
MFVNVAIHAGSGDIFTYSVPEGMEALVCPGKRVLVPFGRRRVTGSIVEIIDKSSRKDLKNIIEMLDEEPLFEERDLAFFLWASRYYLYPLGKALNGILPSGLDVKSRRWIEIAP